MIIPPQEIALDPDEIPTERIVEDGRRIRARQRKAETHRLLVAAAAKAFGEAGYLATTLDQICLYGGVTRGTFYEHFPSKAEAFGAVLDDLVARLTQAVVGVDLEPDAPPPQIQLAGNLLRVLDILLSDRAVARLLLIEAGQEPVVGSKVTALHGFARGMIRQALLDGAPVGLVRPLQAELAAHALLGAILAVMAARLDDDAGMPDLPEQTLARELLTTCLCGVAGEELRLAILGMDPAAKSE
jgi:AcrR family transcriptional regulator